MGRTIYQSLMILATILVIVLAVGLVLPSSVQVERSRVIAATPEQIFPYLVDFRRFQQWSPWRQRDPGMKVEFEGPASGEGAIMHWSSSNEDIAYGSRKVLEARPYRHVKYIQAVGGIGKAYATFTLEPVDAGTRVTWTFDAEFGFNLPARYRSYFVGLGREAAYEQGLAKLATVVTAEQNTNGVATP